MNVHLDEIIGWIDRAFGNEPAVYDCAVPDGVETLRSLLGDEGYQRYQRDQVNRRWSGSP